MIQVGAATQGWPRALSEALGQIEVGPNGTWARVGERRIEDDDPATVYRLVGEAIYLEWHTGRPYDPDTPVPRRIREPRFENQLTERTPHRHFRTPVRVCATASSRRDGSTRVLVDREGVKVWVDVEQIEGPIGELGAIAAW